MRKIVDFEPIKVGKYVDYSTKLITVTEFSGHSLFIFFYHGVNAVSVRARLQPHELIQNENKKRPLIEFVVSLVELHVH